MRQKRLEIYCNRSPWKFGFVDVFVQTPEENGVFHVAQPLTMVPVEVGLLADPTMRIRAEEAQMLMDELWRCGLRPTEGTGSAGSLAATERHLADMRKIAFGFLDAKPNEGK